MRFAPRRRLGAKATFSRVLAGLMHLELFGAPRLHSPASTTVSTAASTRSASSPACSSTRPPSTSVFLELSFLVYLLLSAAPLFFALYFLYAVFRVDLLYLADFLITTDTFTQWLTATGSRASALDSLEGAPPRYTLPLRPLDDGQGYGHFANCGNVGGASAQHRRGHIAKRLQPSGTALPGLGREGASCGPRGWPHAPAGHTS